MTARSMVTGLNSPKGQGSGQAKVDGHWSVNWVKIEYFWSQEYGRPLFNQSLDYFHTVYFSTFEPSGAAISRFLDANDRPIVGLRLVSRPSTLDLIPGLSWISWNFVCEPPDQSSFIIILTEFETMAGPNHTSVSIEKNLSRTDNTFTDPKVTGDWH